VALPQAEDVTAGPDGAQIRPDGAQIRPEIAVGHMNGAALRVDSAPAAAPAGTHPG
jgi:hypothetical protein